MGLTIFISNKDSQVRVLRWFNTVLGGGLVSPCGPVMQFEVAEFRRIGFEMVRQHFVEFRTRQLTKENAIPVFMTRAEKRTIAAQRAIDILEERDGRLRLVPIEIEKLSLSGLKCLPNETHQYVPLGASQDVFWTSFDRALELSVSS